MRKVIVGAMVSMDGVMQAPGGPEEDPTGGFKFGGWTASLGNDPVFDEELGKLFGEPFDLLLGRRTYDIFAAYWPYAEGGPADDIAKTFNRITKYVATRKGVDLKWQGSVALRDAARDVAKLKQEDGSVLVTQGSTELVHVLLAAGLVDDPCVLLAFALDVETFERCRLQGVRIVRVNRKHGVAIFCMLQQRIRQPCRKFIERVARSVAISQQLQFLIAP